MAPTRLNRYLALAGYGTRRSVEGLVRAGRVAVDGVVALEPSAGVEPGQTVTLDGQPVEADGPGGRARRGRRGRGARDRPSERAAPAAAPRPTAAWRRSVSDERLARRLRALGYDPSRLGGAHPEEAASGRSTPASSTRPADSRAPRSARTPARVTARREAPRDVD